MKVSVTRLRKIMLEVFERRSHSAGTNRYFVRFVERLGLHCGKSPDKLGLEHVCNYQSYLLKQGRFSPGSIEQHVSARRLFFVHTLHRHELKFRVSAQDVLKRSKYSHRGL